MKKRTSETKRTEETK